jgi:predicted O-methyltransferase YrrM
MTTKEKRDIFSRRHLGPEVTGYFSSLTAPDEGYAAHVLAAMEKDGVRGLAISPMEGRILESFARLSGARKAVEIGSLYGYSAHWLAKGLADGSRLYSLEKDPACVNAAKEAVEISSLSRKVTVMEGPALENLKTLAKLAPFDLCFIDADAENYPAYLRWAAANLRPGGLVLADGAYLKGALCAGDGDQPAAPAARAMREFFHILFDGDRFVSASVLPTGEGLALGIKA